MFFPSREEARRFFFDTWAKYRRGEALAGLEANALEVIGLHPEYHALLDQPERHLDRDYSPESGEMNPFLHLSLHLAIEEQLSIDQPHGICAQYRRLLEKTGSEHDAKHLVLECLGETIWQAQRYGMPPDEKIYLECLERQSCVKP
ncbi:MAG: DUF1841 family protein [Betaproteobacteria bacterium]|nr:DUF1841 family protein [Betaproteobacteria bacterium]